MRTPHEIQFRWLVRGLLAINVRPTPTKLNRFLGRTRAKTNSINGREAQWRREELIDAGWDRPHHSARWSPPK